jgi:hypothetical protein
MSSAAIDTTLAGKFAHIFEVRSFGYALRDFADRFNHAPSLELVAEEPASLTPVLHDGGVADAYLASAAAWLCRTHGLLIPKWARGSARALETPFFAASTRGLRAILLQESPTEFRIRNLFVSANALSRA